MFPKELQAIYSVSNVEDFVRLKYQEGWVLSSEVVSNGLMSRLFIDKLGNRYTIEYVRNEHRAFVPNDITSIVYKRGGALRNYEIGDTIRINTGDKDCYNGVIAKVDSEPFSEKDCGGYYIGYQRVRFTPPILTGERTVYYDILHPSCFKPL